MADKNIPREEYVGGSIRVGWTISEKHLQIDSITGDLSNDELRALYDRIEDAVTSAIPQVVDLLLDGEDKPAVRVHLEVGCMSELEIDDGPVNGMIEELREELDE